MKHLKKIILQLLTTATLALSVSGCSMLGIDAQQNYDYQKFVLENQIHMTAWDYLKQRANGTPANPTDTVFRWMKKAIDYSGIDTAEYMKSDRTFIFLHNEAIRKVSSNKVTGGFFFDFPIVTALDATTGLPKTTVAATQWTQYDKETVKKYLQYLIIKGNHNFNNFQPGPNIYETLLPVNSTATRESKLGFLVAPATVPGSTDGKTTISAQFTYATTGTAFDPQGKINIQLGNTSDSKIFINGYNVVRSSGYYADNNCSIHVWGTTIFPTQ